jgi:hypothetical protein
MSGSSSFFPDEIELGGVGVTPVVAKYNPDGGQRMYTVLPNVEVLSIQVTEGADPGVAKFRYRFDEARAEEGDPLRIEHMYPFSHRGERIVANDDRLVVRIQRDDGTNPFIFDGYAQIPQIDIDDDTELGHFIALGEPRREWDNPMGGAIVRDGDHPDDISDIQTSMPARFNPKGLPNASPEGYDSGDEGVEYPVFWGPFGDGKEAVNLFKPRLWTLGMVIRYLLAVGRRDKDNIDTAWTGVLDWSAIDEGFQAMIPASANAPVDWENPDTFILADIIVQDFDVKGDAWPVAASKILEPHGFTLFFELDGSGAEPRWLVGAYRKDINYPVKDLYLQAPGVDMLDPRASIVGEISMARDTKDLANRHIVDTAPTLIEASFVLAPAFEIAEADADNKKQFYMAAVASDPDKRKKYRDFIMDEMGEGHWDGEAMSTTRGDIEPIFVRDPTRPSDEDSEEADREQDERERQGRQFVHRRRKPIGDLLTKVKGEAIDAELYISKDYDGPIPGVWDGTGTWQRVQSHQWKLMHEQIGISVTADQPNSFSLGKSKAGDPFTDEKIDIIQRLAKPTTGQPKFYFMLVCVVEDDQGIRATADRRDASPTRFDVTRRTDAADRFQNKIISKYSKLHPTPGPDSRDRYAARMTTKAKDHAVSMRRAHERAELAGNVTIMQWTDAYNIGDKIRKIVGRDIDLRTNAATEEGESPTLPTVVSRTWGFEGRQTTVLSLSDVRAEPPRRRTR